MLYRSLASALIAITAFCTLSRDVRAAVVDFSGSLYDSSGSVAVNALVVAGTFKPGFAVSSYSCVYGDDVCNLNDQNYNQAVADGNFIPIDSALTSLNGVFGGSGLSDAVGSPIWLFGFPSTSTVPLPGHVEVLAISSDSSFIVPPTGSTTVYTFLADTFALGNKLRGGIQLNGIPIPEPTTAVLGILLVACSLATRCRR